MSIRTGVENRRSTADAAGGIGEHGGGGKALHATVPQRCELESTSDGSRNRNAEHPPCNTRHLYRKSDPTNEQPTPRVYPGCVRRRPDAASRERCWHRGVSAASLKPSSSRNSSVRHHAGRSHHRSGSARTSARATDDDDAAYETIDSGRGRSAASTSSTPRSTIGVNARSVRSGRRFKQLIAARTVVARRARRLLEGRIYPARSRAASDARRVSSVRQTRVHRPQKSFVPSEIVAGGHSLAPRFLRYCLAKSRQNLGVCARSTSTTCTIRASS